MKSGKVRVPVTGRLEHPVEGGLHALPKGVAPGLDDHAPSDFGVLGEIGRSDNLLIPFGKIFLACRSRWRFALACEESGRTFSMNAPRLATQTESHLGASQFASLARDALTMSTSLPRRSRGASRLVCREPLETQGRKPPSSHCRDPAFCRRVLKNATPASKSASEIHSSAVCA